MSETDDFDTLVFDAERRAERLIAILRIVIAGTLATAFNLAVVPALPVPAVLAEPVPAVLADAFVGQQISLARITMASYAVIGCVALVLTAPRWHRRSFATVFVTADVLFIFVSLHLSLSNLGIAGNYTVALPTVWLIPVMLAANALRFSWVVQAYAGVLMMLGFFLLQIGPGAGREGTLPAVLYTSFAGPPNIMRLVMVGLACAILVLAVVRTRRLLRTGLNQARRRARLSNYLPPQVTRLIEEQDGQALRAGSASVVVVMFVDIRDFTARAEGMSPEAVGGFLSDFRRVLREAVDEAGGVLDKFMGDGAMVVFAVTKSEVATARQAVNCARDIVKRIAAWSKTLAERGEPPVHVGVGLHLGDAFVGAVGDDERLEFTVVGDVVNIAARMEEATKAVGATIVASEVVLRSAGALTAKWTPLTDAAVRGRSTVVPAYAWRAPKRFAV